MTIASTAVILTLLSSGVAEAGDAAKVMRDYVMAGEVGEAIGGASACGYRLNMDVVNVWTDERIFNMSLAAIENFRNALYSAGDLSQPDGETARRCERRSTLAEKYRLLD